MHVVISSLGGRRNKKLIIPTLAATTLNILYNATNLPGSLRCERNSRQSTWFLFHYQFSLFYYIVNRTMMLVVHIKCV